MIPHGPRSRRLRLITLTGYFGLLGLLLAWYGFISPSTHWPRSLVLATALIPLLFPLRGLLHDRLYTHAWSSMLAGLYLAHAVVESYANEVDRPLALIELLFATLFLVGTTLYTRVRAREMRAAQAETGSEPGETGR